MAIVKLPELVAMQSIADTVSELSRAERQRVAAWLVAFANDQDAEAEEPAAEADEPEAVAEPELAEDLPAEFEAEAEAPEEDSAGAGAEPALPASFAELYAAVAPKTGAQKAAVAAYWLEASEGKASWRASQVNKLLKSLDVRVSSISIVLTNAVKAKNPLVVELERTGASERPRKTFALSDAGAAYVETRLA